MSGIPSVNAGIRPNINRQSHRCPATQEVRVLKDAIAKLEERLLAVEGLLTNSSNSHVRATKKISQRNADVSVSFSSFRWHYL